MRALLRPAVFAAAASLVVAAAGVYETHGSQPPEVPRVGDAVVYPWGDADRTWEVAWVSHLNNAPCLLLRYGDDEVVADFGDVRPAGPLFGL